jgi:hypothetical protein
MLKLTILSIIIHINLITSSDSIVNIDINNFDRVIKNSNEIWVLEIGSKMCGSCAEFLPEFESVAKEMKSINFGATNIDNADGMKLVNNFSGVLDEGVPSVLIFYNIKNNWKFVTAGKVIKRKNFKALLESMTKNMKSLNGKFLKQETNDEL